MSRRAGNSCGGLTRDYVSEYSVVVVNTHMNTHRVKPHSSLASWRKDMGFTQQEAATYLGISQSYYCKLERKAQQPRKDVLKGLTDRTGVPVDELMGIAS